MGARTKKVWTIRRAGLARSVPIGPDATASPMRAFSKPASQKRPSLNPQFSRTGVLSETRCYANQFSAPQKKWGYTSHVRELANEHRTKTVWDILIWDDSPWPLGPTRRLLAVLVLIAGLLTFFLPLISTHPPVSHTSLWSPFDIVRQMYLGHLPQPPCERALCRFFANSGTRSSR